MARSKYNNKRIKVDGIPFDSIKEANRYKELCWLVKAKEITDFKRQPEFILQEGFIYDDIKEESITYKADFMYTEKDGTKVVEDVKGYKTPVYRLKRKLFLKKYCFDEDGNQTIKFIET